MKSSGIKRGLAVSAVTALAFAGLAITPASAQTIAGSGTPLTLYSQYNGEATSNGTVTLLAGMPTAIGPNVNHARFSFSPDGVTWTNIGGPIVPTDGVASLEWAAPVGTWDVRVQAFDNGNNVLDTDITPGVVVAANHPSGDFSNALFADAGQWDDEIVVRGTIADGTDLVSVQARGPEAVTVANGTDIAPGPGTFVGVVDLGINDTGDATDQVVIGANMVDLDFIGTTDDVSVVTVYDQDVTDVTKTLAAGSTMNVVSGSGDDTTYVFHAVDQKSADIQGLDIYEANAAGAPTDGLGDVLNDETDVDGELEVTLNEGDIDAAGDLDPAANASLTYYVVDVNEDGNYDNGTDWLFEVRQTRFAQVATTVEITNELGDVMDDEEDSDVTITVKDQFGNPMSGADVLLRTNRVGHEPVEDPAGTYVNLPGTTNAAGKQTTNFSAHSNQTEVVTFDAYVNADGDPNPSAGDAIATPFVVDTDTTEVNWDDGNKAQALVGSSPTFTGSLVQQNTGKPMPNRPLDIDYASGTGSPGNSILAPQADQPAGTIRGSDTEANVTTGADGTFGVAVTDPVPPDGQELDAELDVSSNSLPNGLDAENDPQTLSIDFLRSVTPDRVRIINPATGDESDGLDPGIFGDLQPGALGIGEVEVENSDGVMLTDVDVDLTIDEGNFVDIFDTPFKPGAPGDPLEWANDGQAITVTTDDGGSGIFATNIERHTGFDDDGLVDDDLSATAGPASDVHDLTWTTNATPLNPRATNPLVVELSADQESSVLPKARAGNTAIDAIPGDGNGQVVDYDVSTFDQFGNPTAQPTTTTDSNPLAGFTGGNQSTFALNQPSISAFAASATNQSLEVELDGSQKVTYVDDPETSEFDPNFPFLALNSDPVQVETNTAPINWYDVNYDASSFTLGQLGPETVPVGTVVTERLTAKDQEGQGLENMPVDFLRGGPGSEDDDTCNEDLLNLCQATDGNGQVFYDFVGGSAGTASVSAVVYTPEGVRIGTFGPDTVKFGEGRVAINAKLNGKTRGNKDILKVNAPSSAEGAKVRLMKKVGNKWKQAGPAKTLNSLGNKSFKKRDRNGNKVTKYKAKVHRTAETKGDWTNVVRQR